MSASAHIVCPSCSSINRVVTSRLKDRPKCGTCKKYLFLAAPVELSSSNFDSHTTRSDIPVVVDFWASWCGPCKMMAPAFAGAAAELEPNVRLAKLNTETESSIAGRFGIRSIPTMVIFRYGKELARQAGAMGSTDIVRWVNSNT